MSDLGGLPEMPFYDEEMPLVGDEQPPTVANNNIPTRQPFANWKAEMAAEREKTHHEMANISRGASAMIPSTFHYREQGIENITGRLYSEPVYIRRPKPGEADAAQRDSELSALPPINRVPIQYEGCKCSCAALGSPKHKIAKRDNKKKDKDDEKM